MANINADGVYQDNLGYNAMGTGAYKLDKITGTLDEKKDRKVYDLDATAITLAANVLVEVGGKSDAIEVTATPENSNIPSLVWESSDEKVATVNSCGEVTGVKAGTVTITATDVENPSVTATSACEVFAVGAIPTFAVTLTAGENGTVEGANPKAIKYSKVTIKAVPNEGYEFEKWSDDDTNAVREITVTEAVTLTATFKAIEA